MVTPEPPVLQAKVTVPVPPVEVAVAAPVAPALHNTLVELAMLAARVEVELTTTEAVSVHPLASVAVTV